MHRSFKQPRTFVRNSDWNSPPIFTPGTVAVTQSLFLSGMLKFVVAKNGEERRDQHGRAEWTVACVRTDTGWQPQRIESAESAVYSSLRGRFQEGRVEAGLRFG